MDWRPGWTCGYTSGVWRCIAILVCATACSLTLPEDLAPLRLGTECAEWTLTDALRVGRGADRSTSQRDLECVLARLRQEWLQGPHQAALASRICFLLADVESDPDVRRLLAAEGARWGEIAESLGALSDAATLYYHAMNLGLAVRDNVVVALKNLGRLEALLTRAAALDPSVDDGGPARVLGMLYIQAPAWPQGVGDPDRGLGLLRWAAKHYPSHPLNHLFLAQALWEVEGEEAMDQIALSLCRAGRLARSQNWGRAGEEWQAQVRSLQAEVGVQCRGSESTGASTRVTLPGRTPPGPVPASR